MMSANQKIDLLCRGCDQAFASLDHHLLHRLTACASLVGCQADHLYGCLQCSFITNRAFLVKRHCRESHGCDTDMTLVSTLHQLIDNSAPPLIIPIEMQTDATPVAPPVSISAAASGSDAPESNQPQQQHQKQRQKPQRQSGSQRVGLGKRHAAEPDLSTSIASSAKRRALNRTDDVPTPTPTGSDKGVVSGKKNVGSKTPASSKPPAVADAPSASSKAAAAALAQPVTKSTPAPSGRRSGSGPAAQPKKASSLAASAAGTRNSAGSTAPAAAAATKFDDSVAGAVRKRRSDLLSSPAGRADKQPSPPAVLPRQRAAALVAAAATAAAFIADNPRNSKQRQQQKPQKPPATPSAKSVPVDLKSSQLSHHGRSASPPVRVSRTDYTAMSAAKGNVRIRLHHLPDCVLDQLRTTGRFVSGPSQQAEQNDADVLADAVGSPADDDPVSAAAAAAAPSLLAELRASRMSCEPDHSPAALEGFSGGVGDTGSGDSLTDESDGAVGLQLITVPLEAL